MLLHESFLVRSGRIAAAAALVAAALAALSACSGQKQQAAAPQPQEVGVVTVRREVVPLSTEIPGRTSAYLVAQVRARVDGIVLKRDFTEGSDVKANQRLYLIDPAPYRAALDSALATLERAQANIASTAALAERYQTLSAGNAVSKQDYDNALAARDQAVADLGSGKAAVETAKINLGYTEVLSPITGRIGISQITPGAYVQASAATLLTTVQQIDPIYVDLTQSSAEGLRLRRDVANGRLKLNGPGQARVTLVLEDGTPYPEKGALQFTDITVDPTTGSVTLRAIFPNPRHVLLPGMFVRARIDEGVNDGAMLVPQVGVTHDAKGQAATLVVGPDDKVAARVIVSGGQKVQPAALVRTVNWQAPAAPAEPLVAENAPAATGSPSLQERL